MYTDEQIYKTLETYRDHAISQGLNVYAIMLKGSQNYNLQDKDSDIDANLIFIPSLSQLRTGESFKFDFSTGEVTCHNIYKFAEIVAKGNPQWIEVCHTNYKLGKSLDMFKHYIVNPLALKGMIMEKHHAFSKLYPSRVKYVEEFGYDPKQLHHIIRLYHSLYHNNPLYCYTDSDRAWMLDIKRGRIPATLKEAEELRDSYIDKLNQIYDQRKLEYKPQTVNYDLLDSIVIQHIRN